MIRVNRYKGKEYFRATEVLIYGGCLVFLLLYHAIGYFGHYGYDDMWYARLAAQIADGTFSLGLDHYGYRWSFIYPLGWIYAWLGISDWTSAVYPWLIHLITIFCIYRIVQPFGLFAVLIAILFFLLHPTSLFYADKIMPDGLIALSILLVFYFLERGRVSPEQQKKYALLLVAALWYGALAKLNIWFAAPLLVGVCLYDLLRKKFYAFWWYTILFLMISFVLYSLLLHGITGNAFARIDAIYQNEYIHECRYDLLPFSATLNRIGFELWQVWLTSGLLAPVWIVLTGLFFAGFALKEKPKQPWHFWSLVAIGLVLSANFLPISLTEYIPLCPDRRHFLFTVPPLAIATGMTVKLFKDNRLFLIPAVLGLAGLSLLSLFLDMPWPCFYYGGLALVFLYLLISSSAPNWIILTVIAGVLFSLPLKSIEYANQVDYPTQKEVLCKEFKKPSPAKKLMVSNAVQCNIGRYWLAFDSSRIKFRAYNKVGPKDLQWADSCYVISNGMMRYLSDLPWEDLPAYVKEKPENIDTVIYEAPVFMYTIEKNLLK